MRVTKQNKTWAMESKDNWELTSRGSRLAKISGDVVYSDSLTIFFYLLMRDELSAGKVEELVNRAVENSEETIFANGWLAQYASNLAEEIRLGKEMHLAQSIGKVDDSGCEKTEDSEECNDSIENAINNLIEQSNNIENGKFSVDQVVDAIDKLRSEGHISDEDAGRVLDEVNEECDDQVSDEHYDKLTRSGWFKND